MDFPQPEPQARQMAVEYARTVFPPDHIPSRYVLLLACGDEYVLQVLLRIYFVNLSSLCYSRNG